MLRAGVYFFDHIFFENGSGCNKLANVFLAQLAGKK
jgi:hypothetical protein